MRRMSCAVALVALIGVYSGCYHHHLRANGDRVNSSYFRKTLDSPSGGKRTDFVVPAQVNGAQVPGGLASSADCKGNGMYEVGITSYWKYAAGNVFSFGQWSRVKVEWLCAKQPSVIGPTGLGPRPPAASEAARPTPSVSTQPRKVKQDELTKRTMHAFFWGALQQNLLPPAPSAAYKTPANCKSMRLVKLPVNYGYSLITVVTAGLWSPMRVTWQCAEDPSRASQGPAPGPAQGPPKGLPGTINPPPLQLVPLRAPYSSAGPSILSSKEANDVPR
ncbi:MAG: hypothetical protein AABN34_01690 [Acidobacteriota bacterium]